MTIIDYNRNNGNLKLEWSLEVEKFFHESRIFLDYPNKISGIFQLGEIVNIPGCIEVEKYANMPRKRFISAGAFSYCKSASAPPELKLGRYCSVGPSVMLNYQEHPTERISTHPFTTHAHMARMSRDEFGKSIIQHQHKFTLPPPVIGSDVWIGAQVIIKRNITIGHGAIIGTRALLTKDVPPFAIVGGIPAKVIRYRFDQSIINRLLSLQWWNYNFADFGDLDPTNVLGFIEGLEEKIQNGQIKEMQIEPMPLATALAQYLSKMNGMT